MKKPSQLRKHVQVWGGRTLAVVLLVAVAQHWGPPLYKQYFVSKKKTAYIPTAKVRAGKFVVSFHEIGTLEAEKSVPVNAEAGGKIISLVGDGKVVPVGTKIAELDTTEILREVRNQTLSHQNSMADVDRVKAELEILRESNRTEVEKAEAQVKYDETELERARNELAKMERLAKEKLVRQAEVDQAEVEVRSKELKVLQGQKDLALKKKEVESKEQQKLADVRNKEFASSIQKSALEETEGRVKLAVITAPASGLVVISKDWTPDGRRKLQEGDSIRPRQQICSLPDLSSMLVKVNVGESDAPRVKLGMPTIIRLEAVPNKVFNGVVEDMSNLATEAMPWETGSTPGRKNFEVTIQVKEVDPKTLKPGMTADVEFVCDTVDKALFVPVESITERSGKTYTFLKDGKTFKQVEVKTGKQSDNFVCITRGLKAGQVIALRDPTKSLDEQESGTAAAENGKKTKAKEPAPIPEATKK